MTDMTSPLQAFDALVVEAPTPGRPSDQEIEATLLAALFTSPDATAKILADTRPTEFRFDIHRSFAKAIWPALIEGRHVDAITFDAALPQETDPRKAEERGRLVAFAGQVFDRARTDPPTLGKVEAYLSIQVEAALWRHARSLVTQVGEELDKRELSPTGAAAKVFEVIADLEAARRLGGAFKSEGDDWPSYMAALEASQQAGRDFLGLDTGFSHLNFVANGLTESLLILGASPSTGKTTFAKQLTDQVAEANATAACLFVSLEQSREELRVKTLSRLSGVENRDILRGRLDVSEAAWANVKKAAGDYHAKTAGRVFILEGDKTTTPERIRLAALQIKRATQVETVFIVIDYLQIVPTEVEYRDPRNRVDAVVSDLRRIARDLHSPVMAVSSIGRASYSSPNLSAFKESGGIEYAADIGVIMTRDKEKRKGQDPVGGALRSWLMVDLNVVKNRNGERAKIAFKFYPAVSRFVECDKSSLTDDPFEAASED